MMSKISKLAGCSEVYTKHCLRATAITKLSNANIDSRTIATLSGHKNYDSITSCCKDSSSAQKQEMFGILHRAMPFSIQPNVTTPSRITFSAPNECNVSCKTTDNTNNLDLTSAGVSCKNMFSACNFSGNVNVTFQHVEK